MASRWFALLVLAFWLVSMSWLGMVKIVPTLELPWLRQPAPSGLDRRGADGPAAWEIRWNDRPIGWAASRVEDGGHGLHKVSSLVQFDELPLGELARELLGALGSWLTAERLEERDLPVPLQVRTDLLMDSNGAGLRGFDSTVHLGEMRDLITFHGRADDDKLRIEAAFGEALAERWSLASRQLQPIELELPREMPLSDGLTPLSNLHSLRVGQTWTFRTLRPLPLGNPFRIARATVENEDVIQWDNRRRKVLRVVIRDVDSSTLSAARRPFSEVWVQPDGRVLRQRLRLADITIDFVRLAALPRAIEEF